MSLSFRGIRRSSKIHITSNYSNFFISSVRNNSQFNGDFENNINIPSKTPPPNKLKGSIHWKIDKIVNIGFLPLIGGSMFMGSCFCADYLMCGLLLHHFHNGLKGVITDYIAKRNFPILNKNLVYILTFFTGLTGFGMYRIYQQEHGFTRYMKRLFSDLN